MLFPFQFLTNVHHFIMSGAKRETLTLEKKTELIKDDENGFVVTR